MMKYMGTRPTSQNTKKISRSSAMKTPSMPVSRNRNNIIKALTLSLMPNDARMASGVRSVVSKTIVSERPSTPRCEDEPMASYQTYVSSNRKPDRLGWNLNQAISERMKWTRLAAKANQRKRPFSSFGRNSIPSTASAGKKRMSERRCVSMKFINGSLSKQEVIEYNANGNERDKPVQEILLDAPRLNSAQFASKPVCDVR